MDSSEVGLDKIEAQRSTDVSRDERKQRYSPINLIKRTLRSLGFLQVEREGTLPTRDTETVPEFLTNILLSDIFNLPKESVLMNPKLFSEVSAGNKKCLEKLGTQIACLKSERGDSMLHLVATWGHLELMKSILSDCPSLLLVRNSKGQLPLHVAASAGQIHVVEALVAAITFLSAKLPEEERERLNIYVAKDKDGDTPLHAALKDHHMAIAACLLKANQQASFLANNDKISPLYLAVEAGNFSLVRAMLDTTCNHDDLKGRDSNLLSQLEGKKNLVHAALKAKNTDILDAILKEDPNLEDERDEEGRTCLSFGAAIGYYKGVCKLLDRSTRSVYVCNNDGSFPIHVAVETEHMNVAMELIRRCPDSKYLLNKQGQNILHIEAKIGTRIRILLNISSLEKKKKHLMVEQDVDGNTPLHLATINWRYFYLYYLLGICGEKWRHTRNNSGSTALDIARSKLHSNYVFTERMTEMVLLWFSVPSSSDLSFKKRRTPKSLDHENTKDYVNTLLVIAALVATVTFAGGFTIPGGFNSSAPNLGMATLAHDRRLVIFMVFDTLAMQSSVLTIAILIWSQFGDPTLIHDSLYLALPLLFFALLCMSVAFFCGVLVVFRHVIVLVVFLSITFFYFFNYLLFILGPHVILHLLQG